MKKNFFIALLVLLFASPAFSMPLLTDQFIIHGTSRGNVVNSTSRDYAAEYDLEILSTSSHTATNYVSFCLERLEDFTIGRTYDVQSVEEFATSGGIGGATAGQDDLSDATKWVYAEYTFGDHFSLGKDINLSTLGFSHFSTNDVVYTAWGPRLGMYVQEIIWYLEDESFFNNLSIGAQWIYNNKVAGQNYDTSGYNIKALNYLLPDGSEGQSHIIGEPVPEPATMLLFATGLIGLAGVSYRRKKK